MATLTINHYINQVNNFINNLTNTRNSFYVFAGRSHPWDNDTSPPSSNGSISQIEQTVYEDLLYGKRITSSDVSALIPRYNWTSNTVYASYDQTDADLYSKQFYVMNDLYQVYKCVFNNNGAASTVKPSLSSAIGTFNTSDGYIWKYMYSIDTTANTKFTSADYIPVSTNAAVQGNTTPGSIDAIVITDGGSNYQVFETGYIYKLIDKYTIQLPSTSSSEDNYYVNSSIYLKSGWGAGQVREIVSSNGASKQIRVSASNPFDTHSRLDFANTPSGTILSGYTAIQNYDYVQYYYTANNGYFNSGTTLVQSDTGTTGTILTSNSSTLTVARTSTNTFSLSYPVRDASQDGVSKPGTVNIISGNNYVIANSSTQFTDAANGYSSGDYIRVGPNANTNIRRVTSVNSTVVVVDTAFAANLSGASTYKMPVAAMPSSITIYSANGIVSNTNLTSNRLSITNSSISGAYFIVGEKVNLVDSANTNQGANATVAFANSSTVYLSSVAGTWSDSLYIRGDSSLQRSYISSVDTNPNIVISNPQGSFLLGQPVYFTFNGANTASALLGSVTTLPNDQTEYQIGPTVSISGDGVNAIAVGIVNNSVGSGNNIIAASLINSGINYTYANVTIYANNQYGSNATAKSVIAPINGHGFDVEKELGARYVGITKTFDTGVNEGYFFPTYSSYRRVGIIQNPQFSDVRIELGSFDRVNLEINNKVTSTGNLITNWVVGEVVVQPSTNAAGLVASGNSSTLQLKNVLGTFSAGNASIKGYYSNTTANVASSNVIYFQVTNDSTAEIVSETTSGATGEITFLISNTNVVMSNVVGQFVTGDVLYDSTVNAYAVVGAISTANGSRDVTNSFGDKFNQTLRLTLSSNTNSYQTNETVIQEVTNASGRVVSTTNELDISYTAISGTFSVGQTLTDQTSHANGIISFANTTYLKLTGVSQELNFSAGHVINNGLGANGSITGLYSVLLLNNVNEEHRFQESTSYGIVGQVSGARGICNSYSLITYPELVRNSGKVIYTENITPVTRTASSKEDIKLVIKL